MHLVQISALCREYVCKGKQYISNVHTLDFVRGRLDYGRENMRDEDRAVSEQEQGYPEIYPRNRHNLWPMANYEFPFSCSLE
jgi:hypothetical protein